MSIQKEVQAVKATSINGWPEDNSKSPPFELKNKNKSAYGVIKSLSMDTNADVYDRTDTQFCLWWKYVVSDAGDLKKARKFIFFSNTIIERGLMWNSILEILEEKELLKE